MEIRIYKKLKGFYDIDVSDIDEASQAAMMTSLNDYDYTEEETRIVDFSKCKGCSISQKQGTLCPIMEECDTINLEWD